MYRPPFLGVYATMDFPAYEFKEYPKAIKVVQADGSVQEVVVPDQRTELAMRANGLAESEHPAVVERNEAIDQLVAKQDENAALLAKMAEMEAELAKLKAPAPAPVGDTAKSEVPLAKPNK